MSPDPFYDAAAGYYDDAWDTWDGVERITPSADPCYVARLSRRSLRAWRPLRHHVAVLARRVYAAVLRCGARRR